MTTILSKQPCQNCGCFEVEFYPRLDQDADSLPWPHCTDCGQPRGGYDF